MLSARLVRTIEDHAEGLTRGVLEEISRHPLTPAYHGLAGDELERRIYDVYHNLGRWLGDKREEDVAHVYSSLGARRRDEGIPLAQVVYALVLIKRHLRDYMMKLGGDSAVELYQEEQLHTLLENFFDKAIYFAIKGYEDSRPA
jgi:hypothetical protein